MALLIPEHPTFANSAERQVWERLRDQLGDDDVLLANVRIMDAELDHEADLVVLMPDFGVLVLEVKAGSIQVEPNTRGDLRWTQGAEGRRIDPVNQVMRVKHALRRYVIDHRAWSGRSAVAFTHGVVFPHSTFPDDFEMPDLPRAALHGRSDLATLVMRLRKNAYAFDENRRRPDLDDVRLIGDILGGRLATRSYDVEADAAERAAEADRLTAEQAAILGVTRLLNRVEVRGGAGSGKTVLALQQAKQLTHGRGDQGPQRVAMLCYSIGLAAYLKREVAAWPASQRPAFVGTFHEFGRQWGAPDGDRMDSEFWEVTLPALMADLAAELPDGQKYDAVIIDEAQDFAENWWPAVLGALRDEDQGGVFVYSDENQRIFGRFGRPPLSLVPLVLDHNLRNTREIHASFDPLAPSRMEPRGGHGPSVQFMPTPTQDPVEVADAVVDILIDEGWEPGSIALITTGHRHPEQEARTSLHGQEGYWERFWAGDEVFYGHVLGCKGLERKAVVLCVNEREVKDRARERIYVGMSRATDRLIVVADPEIIRAMGGDEVAMRLGIRAGSRDE